MPTPHAPDGLPTSMNLRRTERYHGEKLRGLESAALCRWGERRRQHQWVRLTW